LLLLLQESSIGTQRFASSLTCPPWDGSRWICARARPTPSRSGACSRPSSCPEGLRCSVAELQVQRLQFPRRVDTKSRVLPKHHGVIDAIVRGGSHLARLPRSFRCARNAHRVHLGMHWTCTGHSIYRFRIHAQVIPWALKYLLSSFTSFVAYFCIHPIRALGAGLD